MVKVSAEISWTAWQRQAQTLELMITNTPTLLGWLLQLAYFILSPLHAPPLANIRLTKMDVLQKPQIVRACHTKKGPTGR